MDASGNVKLLDIVIQKVVDNYQLCLEACSLYAEEVCVSIEGASWGCYYECCDGYSGCSESGSIDFCKNECVDLSDRADQCYLEVDLCRQQCE